MTINSHSSVLQLLIMDCPFYVNQKSLAQIATTCNNFEYLRGIISMHTTKELWESVLAHI